MSKHQYNSLYWLSIFALLLSLVWINACASTSPKKALDEADAEIARSQEASTCAKESYEAAVKMLEEAKAAAAAGNNEEARKKAQTAKRLAETARREAKLNEEECQRLRAAQAKQQENTTTTEKKIEITNDNDVQFEVIYFDFDEAVLTQAAQQAVKHNADKMKAHANLRVDLASHTDERGTGEYNLALSEKRGQTVQTILQRYGIESARARVVPYGKERLASFGTADIDHAKNRRVEFEIRR